jgi:putative nucleotidyltransferase with HDIG domain
MIGLAFLMGLIADNSLEVAALVGGGGSIGALTLRRSERLNSYFFVGVIVALANVIVVTLFNLGGRASAEGVNVTLLIIYALVNGLLAGMIALAILYLVTLGFNLPTSLKLVELSQPNQPLLQRLLREAPGTYQHSLQVSNLSEQAANAVGANAALVRVAALYHDLGKILNPAFFVENQVDNVNPHDMLKDPYRSASIIISHVTDGEKLARQYRLPQRIRDFILEHHGTTLVSYFYTQAVAQAGDDESVDSEQFTYPGPKPQTRETAILMLADSCESTVRAGKPSNKAEIEEIVDRIFESRLRDGQLNEANLTLNDLESVREIFVEMLQAVFHPRINYPTSTAPAQISVYRVGGDLLPEGVLLEGDVPILPGTTGASSNVFNTLPLTSSEIEAAESSIASTRAVPTQTPPTKPKRDKRASDETQAATQPSPLTPKPETRYSLTQEIPPAILDDDDSPLPNVPRLPRSKPNGGEKKSDQKADDSSN